MPESASGQLRPRLLRGESTQAFLSATFFHASEQTSVISGESFNLPQLRSLLSIRLFFVVKGYADILPGSRDGYEFLRTYLIMLCCF
jgi:hypothetical protein